MVEILQDILGEQLWSWDVHGTGLEFFPSPDSLKGKIILKGQYMPPAQNQTMSGSTDGMSTPRRLHNLKHTRSNMKNEESIGHSIHHMLETLTSGKSDSDKTNKKDVLEGTADEDDEEDEEDEKMLQKGINPDLSYIIGMPQRKTKGFGSREDMFALPPAVASFGELKAVKWAKKPEILRGWIDYNQKHFR